MTWQYEDFSLHITVSDDELNIHLLSSPAGESDSRVVIPFTVDELSYVHGSLDPSSNDFDHTGRSLVEVGGRLFDAVFAGIVGTQFRRSLDMLSLETGLRIRLRLDSRTAELGLPWELLYDTQRGKFLNLSARTPVVRHTPLPAIITPLLSAPPLRIVVVVAEPVDMRRLDGEREWRRMNQAFAELQDQGRVELVRPAAATFEHLGQVLDAGQYQILHFIGHGRAGGPDGESVVHFEERNSREDRPISGRELGVLVSEHPSLRLVFLNSCEGASALYADMTGMATALVRNGVPAVIAMEHRISDDVAEAFSARLYREIALGEPVDAAVALARGEVYRRRAHAEWSTPILYMRASNGTVLEPPRRRAAVSSSRDESDDLMVGNIRSSGHLSALGKVGLALQQNRLPLFVIAILASVILVPIVSSSMIEGPLGRQLLVFGIPQFALYPYEVIIFALAAISVVSVFVRWGARAGLSLCLGFVLSAPIMIYSSYDGHDLFSTYAGWALGFVAVVIVMIAYRRLTVIVRRIRRRNRRV